MSNVYVYKGRYWEVLNEYTYTGESVPFTLQPGSYLLICNGAMGGKGRLNVPTYGGVSYGILTLSTETDMFVNVGGNGNDSVISTGSLGGYNGGGNGGAPYNSSSYGGAGGGGATDFRINTDSLYSRVIVAGGGGGGSSLSTSFSDYAGGGGGPVGGYVECGSTCLGYHTYATQMDGFSFGIGETALDKTSSTTLGSNGAGGGGGGWYGGYSCQSTDVTNSSANGGGGSGYVFTSKAYKPDGYLLNEEYHLTDTFMDSGKSSTSSALVCKLINVLKIGDKLIFPCIGDVESIILPIGEYNIKCYGGNGDCRYVSSVTAKGGYTEGLLHNQSPVKIFVHVGGSGIRNVLTGIDSYADTYSSTTSHNGGGSPSVTNDIASCGGGGSSDIRIGTDDLLSRIIVAGGAGGLGSSTSYGGNGGGTTGGVCTGKYGTSPGPGTQNSSPQNTTTPTINGGFGYGGNAVAANGGYGGAGGGGWYGGSGTQPDGSSDDDKGGNGGSGYALTNDSYKPNGYLLGEEYYLSNVVMTNGGNNLPCDQTMITMDIIDISTNTIICHDSEGYKRYDNASQSWVYLSDELTNEMFSEYGVMAFLSDNGLMNEYEILFYDELDKTSRVDLNVIPIEQSISSYINISSRITNNEIDAEYDNTKYSIRIESERMNGETHLTTYIHKLEETNTPLKLYCVNSYIK